MVLIYNIFMIKRILVLASQRKKSQDAITFFSKYPNKYKISALMCTDESQFELFKKQIIEIKPDIVFFPSKDGADKIIDEFNIVCFYEYTQYTSFLKAINCDLVISDLTGIDSIKLILATVGEYKDICFLNLESILYSGKIIINEARNKGVTLNFITNQFYSIDLFQKQKSNLDNINKVILVSYDSQYDKEELINYTHPSKPLSEFKKILYYKNKMWLSRHLMAFSNFYNLDLEKFEYYKSNSSQVSVILQQNNGSNCMVSTEDNKELIFEYYYPSNTKASNRDIAKTIDIKLQKIKSSDIQSLDLATKAMIKGGTYPILYQMAYDLCAEATYNNRTKDKNVFFKVFEEVLKDKTYYSKNINIQTIFALFEKLKTKIETEYLKKEKKNNNKIKFK
jgi:1-deoxy-D-xylulose 5-phosphate reductoisomerase